MCVWGMWKKEEGVKGNKILWLSWRRESRTGEKTVNPLLRGATKIRGMAIDGEIKLKTKGYAALLQDGF